MPAEDVKKECVTCHKPWPIRLFGKSARHKSGIENRCLFCRRKQNLAYVRSLPPKELGPRQPIKPSKHTNITQINISPVSVWQPQKAAIERHKCNQS